MIALRPTKLHWIGEADDDPLDQCAHGNMELTIDGTTFVEPASGPWNLTMAALYLLRTITADHTAEHPVAEQNFVIPCCGHSPWLVGEGEYPLLCQGCNSGIDFEIVHTDSLVTFSSGDRALATASISDWARAVVAFVVQIEQFYASCSPKVEPDERELDRPGWAAFWREWSERKRALRVA